MTVATETAVGRAETVSKGARPRRSRIVRRGGRKNLLSHHALLIGTLLLVGTPIVVIGYQSLLDKALYRPNAQLTFDNYLRVFSDSGLLVVLRDTVLFGIGATAMAVGIGVLAAIIVGRTNVRLPKVLDELQVWPLYFSPLVLAFGWVIAYGPTGIVTSYLQNIFGIQLPTIYSIPGLILIAGSSLAPFVYLMTRAAAVANNPDLEAAGRIGGMSPRRVMTSILLPLLRPSIAYATLLTFVTAIETLSIPLIIGQPVGIRLISNYLYEETVMTPQPDYGLMAAMAVLMLIFIMVLVMAQARFLRNAGRFVTIQGKAPRQAALNIGRARGLLFAVLLFYSVVTVVIPVLGMLLRSVTSVLSSQVSIADSLTLDNYRTLLDSAAYRSALTNSLFLGVVGGAISIVVITFLVFVAKRSDYAFRGALDHLAMWPRAFPGVVFGIGVFWTVILFQLGWLRSSLWFLIVVLLVRYLPHGYAAIAPVMMRFSADLDNAAKVSGASWWVTARRILLPLSKTAMASGYILMFLLFLKEYASLVFLYTSGNEVIGVTLLSSWAQGAVGSVAALAFVQAMISIVVVYGARRVMGVRINA